MTAVVEEPAPSAATEQTAPAGLTVEILKALMEPFPKEVIGKRPKLKCKDCAENRGQCPKHRKEHCRGCGQYISTAHIDLDFVGHAEVTRRLLLVDPNWNWEPVAFSADGLPKFDEHGGLWIRLTVAGKTVLGYGHAEGKKGPDAIKEAIGDAIRNAAMRMGVALDLWRHEAPAVEPDQDGGWFTDTQTRIIQARSRGELEGIGQEIVSRIKTGGLDPTIGDILRWLYKARTDQLAREQAQAARAGSSEQPKAAPAAAPEAAPAGDVPSPA
mgnify:CR=1 FL=1